MSFDKMEPPNVVQLSAPQTTRSQTLNEKNLASVEKLKLITKCARQLFQSYPSTDYDDPKAALASYIEVLGDYSEAIVDFVTSNKTGIQRRLKFPPRIAEIVDACNEASAHIAKFARFQNWGKVKAAMIEGPQEQRPTEEEMLAKYGPNYGLDPNFGAGKDRAVFGVNFSAEAMERAAEACKREKVAFDQPVTHRSFKEAQKPEQWAQQSHPWEKIIPAYAAEPDRMKALAGTPFMNRSSKGALKEPSE